MRAILLIAVMVLHGCRAAPSVEPNDTAGNEASASEMTTVLGGLQERAELLQQLHGWGIVELRWTDEEGDHFEQGDLEFWIDGPDRLAVRISKLGDPYFWIGTDGTQAWIFDLSQQPRRLLVDPMAKIRAAGRQRGTWLSIMDTVRMMRAGLGTLPPPREKAVLDLHRGEGTTWWLTARAGPNDERRLRLHVDSNTWRPLHLELLNANGTRGITLGTRSSRTKRIKIPNRSSLAWPIVSAVMEVRDDTAADTFARFAFEGFGADLSEEPLERVFDLDTLRAALRPDVEGPLLDTRPGDDLSTER